MIPPSPPPRATSTFEAAPPPSYRTRVGLYYVPQDPATEPSLPEDLLLAGGDSRLFDSITRPAPRSFWRRVIDLLKGR